MDQLGDQQTPPKMVKIVDYCLALPYWSRVRLMAALKDSILEDTENPERRLPKILEANRGRTLLQVMGQVIGEPVDLESRHARFAWARAMVAYQLTQEGFSTSEVGEQIGRDHATVSYHNSKMRFILDHPYAYKDIVDIWKQFQNRLQYDINKGTDGDPLQMGV